MSDLRLAEVVTLHPAKDCVRMLRLMADDVEAGKYGNVRSISAVLEQDTGSVEVFGWGDLGLLRTIGLLQLGVERTCRMRLRRFEDG